MPLDGGFVYRTPRLVAGSRAHPTSGLLAMREAFAAALGKAVLFDTRALSIRPGAGLWQVYLANGERIAAPKILLAAGVVGTARLAHGVV